MEPRPRPLPALLDELVEEVLLRCPPDDPARLLRAALVCKRWCRLICGAGFRRRFWELHRTPPMLGFFYNVGSFSKFIPTFTPCPPLADARHRRVIDARHGRVLYHSADWQPWQNPLENAFVLWDPITGERRELPLLPVALNPYSWNAAVLCAGSASGDCDHIDCHSRPFLVVLVITVRMVMFACVYSSEAGVWSEPTTAQHPYSEVELRPRGAVVGNTLYFALRYNKAILKYNLSTREVSVIDDTPAECFFGRIVLMTMKDGELGLATMVGYKLYMWSRREAGPDEEGGWIESRVIELQTLLPTGAHSKSIDVVGYADGVGVVFLSIDNGIFTMDLKSSRVRKVCKEKYVFDVLPYMSFDTPALGVASTGEGPRARTSSA